MRHLLLLFLLFIYVISEAGNLSLKNGTTLNNAEIKGISGRNIVIVKHSGGVGMYSYSQFLPESEEVISNLYPDAAAPAPVATPPAPVLAPPAASGPSGGGNVNMGAGQVLSPVIEAAIASNNRLYKTTNARVSSSIAHDRDILKNKLEANDEKVKWTKEVERLSHLIQHNEAALNDLNIYRDETQPNRRQKNVNGGAMSWDQQQTVLFLELRDKRKELTTAESNLKDIVNSIQRCLDEFDSSTRQRLKRVDDIFADHNRRLQSGELLTDAVMEAAYFNAR